MKKLLKSIIYGICNQCTGELFTVKKSNVTAEKKKKKRSVNKRKRSFQPNLNGHTMLTVSLVKQKTRRPLIIYQEARGPLKRTPKKKKKKNFKVRTRTIQCERYISHCTWMACAWKFQGYTKKRRKARRLGPNPKSKVKYEKKRKKKRKERQL